MRTMSETSSSSSAQDATSTPVPGSADITRRLLEAGVKVFGQQGFEAATVAEISSVAGVTTGALFRRWRTKHDFFVTVIEHVFAPRLIRSLEEAELSPAEQLHWLASNLLNPQRNEIRDFRLEVFAWAGHDETVGSVLARSIEREASDLAAILTRCQVEGLLDLEADTKTFAFYCQALGLGISLLRRVLGGEPYMPSDADWRAFIGDMFESSGLQAPRAVVSDD